MNKKNLHKDHRKRLREKYINSGAENLFDHELLEIMLFSVIKQKNTNETAHLLINKFGSLPAVFEADFNDLLTVEGIGEKSAEYIKFISDFMKFCKESNEPIIKLQTYNDMADFFMDYFKDNPSDENCVFLSMNENSEIMGKYNFEFSKIISGQLNLKNITEILVKGNVKRVIIGVKHYDGNAQIPFTSDFSIFKKFLRLFSQAEINITDFIVCNNKKAISIRKYNCFLC